MKQKLGMVFLGSVEKGSAVAHHFNGTKLRLEHPPGDFEVVAIAASSEPHFIKRFASVNFQALASLRKVDAIVSRSHLFLAPFYLVARMLGVPYVILVQGAPSDIYNVYPKLRPVSKVLERIIRLNFSNAAAVVTVNEGLSTLLRDQYFRETDAVIPNGAPLVGPPVRPTAELPDKFALFAGAFASWQGIDILLDAIDDPYWPESTKLVLVGYGAEQARIDDYARRGKISYLGRLDPEELAWVFSRASMSLSPKLETESTRHGISPFKVMESINHGVPVVCTDIKGQSDLMNEIPVGFVVSPGSASELARAVAKIAEDSRLRNKLSDNCLELSKKFAWEAGAEQLQSLIRSHL